MSVRTCVYIYIYIYIYIYTHNEYVHAWAKRQILRYMVCSWPTYFPIRTSISPLSSTNIRNPKPKPKNP